MLSHVCLVFLSATVRNSFLFHIVQIPHYMCLWHTALCACKCANMLMNDPVGPNKDVSIRRRRRGQKQMSESQKKCQLKCSQRSQWNVLIGFFCTFHTSVWRPSNDQNLKFHIFTRLSGRWTRTLNPFRFDPWPQAPNWLPCSPRDKSEISGISQICRSGCEQLLHQPEPWTPNQSNSGSHWGVGGGRGDGAGGRGGWRGGG